MKISLEDGHVCIRDEKGWLLWGCKLSELDQHGLEIELKPLSIPTSTSTDY